MATGTWKEYPTKPPTCDKCNDSGMILSKAIVYHERTGEWHFCPVPAMVPCQHCDRADVIFTLEYLRDAYDQIPDAWKAETTPGEGS